MGAQADSPRNGADEREAEPVVRSAVGDNPIVDGSVVDDSVSEGAGHPDLPAGLVFQRVTNDFTSVTVPAGLLKAHRIAEGVWGVLRVRDGRVRFVEEIESGRDIDLAPGEANVIRPGVPHRVEPSEDATFAVEFYR